MGIVPERKIVPLRRRAKHVRHASWSGPFRELDARVAELERRLYRLDRRFAAVGVDTRLRVAFVVSLLFHAFIVFGITFKMPDKIFKDDTRAMEVVLVNAKSKTKPLMADAHAQHNLDGGGNTDEKRRARSPLPAVSEHKQATELALAQRRVQQLEREARQVIAQAKPSTPIATAAPVAHPEPQPSTQTAPNAADLMQRSLQIARLEAQIAKNWDAYQQRPRRRFIGARTQEFRFARYVEDWRMKIERVGELNYPQAARDQRVYGSLVATVSINADGSLEKVEINRSSGQKVLDEAALRIVKLAAPYSPFPADIAKDTDILSITRTWIFTRADQFVAE